MALSVKKIRSSNTIRWMWPVKLGLPKRITSLKKELLANHWAKTFVTVEEAKNGGHYNIIFFDASIKLEEYRPWGTVTADCIFVFLKKKGSIPAGMDTQAPELLKHFNASGVFVFHAADMSRWFSALTEELSHNNNIVKALALTGADGKCWYDPKLLKQTTLSYVIDKMAFTLETYWFSNQVFKVKNRLTKKTSFTGQEIVDLLRSEVRDFKSEIGSASDLKDISKQVFKKTPVFFDKADMPVKKMISSHQAPKRAKPPAPITITRSTSVGRKGSDGGPAGMGDEAGWVGDADLEIYIPKKAGAKPRLLSHAKPPAAVSAKEKPAEPDESPRYLQANIKTGSDKKIKNQLKPDTAYNMEVRIGYPDKDFVDSGTAFDTKTVFEKSKQAKETIQVKFRSNLDKKVQFRKITLPRQGNSSSVQFGFKTNTASNLFEGDIFAYHKSRLIQQVRITADIDKKATGKSAVKMKLIFCTRKNLGDMKERTSFSASVEYEAGAKKSSTLHGIAKNKPLDLYFETGLKGHLADMKKAIEDALIDTKKHPAKLRAKGNQELLLTLAFKGNLIYTNLLRGAIAPEGPLQIISNNQEYVPLDFVYSLAAPSLDATLCDHAETALKEGACKNCFDHSKDNAPHICPFGFWAFSRIVERHSYKKRKNNRNSDYRVVSEPYSNRDPLRVLQNSLYGSSQRVETSETNGIRQQIAAGIKKNSVELFVADSWKDWTLKVSQKNPDSLILVVHVEKNKKVNIDQIEIGNNDFMIQNQFGSQIIANKTLKPPPFVIIIGCESTNLEASGFDISAQLMNEGAAIVLSNFTKIRGRQAKDVVIKLVEFLKQNGKTETLFGEVMLRLRQYLLSEGMMAGLTLVAQGDADWKIKS